MRYERKTISHTFSADETQTCAARIAETVSAGGVVCLQGELGAGKTTFVKGFARAKGYPHTVTSPTFEIVHEYTGGTVNIYHFDFYRIDNLEDVYDTGFEDYLYKGGICLIEWFDVVLPLFGDYTKISIDKDERNAEGRVITYERIQNIGR